MKLTERYVDLEVSKLLEKCGFDTICGHCYGICVTYKGKIIDLDEEIELKEKGLGKKIKTSYALYNHTWCKIPNTYPAPTQQMACDFLRTFDIYVYVVPTFDNTEKYECHIIHNAKEKKIYSDEYADAMNAGLLYGLKVLENAHTSNKI